MKKNYLTIGCIVILVTIGIGVVLNQPTKRTIEDVKSDISKIEEQVKRTHTERERDAKKEEARHQNALLELHNHYQPRIEEMRDVLSGLQQEKVQMIAELGILSSDFITGSQLLKPRGIEGIVVHHSATDINDDFSVFEKQTWTRHKEELANSESCFGYYTSYHFAINKDGRVKQYRCLNEVGHHVAGHNGHTIGIVLLGNFDEVEPTEEQYKSLKALIGKIRNVYEDEEIPVYEHGELSPTGCAGHNFSINILGQTYGTPILDELMVGLNELYDTVNEYQEEIYLGQYIGERRLTRYYSPEAGQSRYAYSDKLKRRRNLVEEVYMQCGYDEDLTLEENVESCKYSSNGWELHEDHSGTIVACPSKYEFGTVFHIEGWGDVTCVDRGGSIEGQRLDLRAGYGEQALDKIETGYGPQYANIYIKDALLAYNTD